MSNFKIIGPSNPEVGKEIIYKTSNSNLPLSLPGQSNPFGNSPFAEQVKWSIYVLEYGKWILKEKNNKTGPTANYTFTEVSLKRQGIRIVALFGNEKAILDIKPLDTIERKIVKVELCDALGNLQTKPFTYNQTVLARVHCLNLDNCTVHVTLWEDDAPGAGHDEINKNNKAITKSELVANGIANVKFKLAPDFAKMANAQLAKGDKSEGKTHEYYVTAEVFRQQTKSSNNIDVTNPNNKTADTKATPQKPASQKPVTKPAAAKPAGPAAKKGPSKKEEKGVTKPAGGTVYDWGESVLKAIPIILPDPIEIVNSLAKLFAPDKKDEKKDEKEKCPRCEILTAEEMTKVFTGASADDKDVLRKAFNDASKKFGLNTCQQKAHFFAQVMEEVGVKINIKGGENLNYLAEDLPINFSRFRIDPSKKYNKITNGPNDLAYKYGRIEEIKNGKKVITQKADQEMIANITYANKEDNGDKDSGDGWKYRGRGIIQITFKRKYTNINRRIKDDYPEFNTVIDADNINNLKEGTVASMAYWEEYKCQQVASKGYSKKELDAIVDIINKDTESRNHRWTNLQSCVKIFKIDECKNANPKKIEVGDIHKYKIEIDKFKYDKIMTSPTSSKYQYEIFDSGTLKKNITLDKNEHNLLPFPDTGINWGRFGTRDSGGDNWVDEKVCAALLGFFYSLPKNNYADTLYFNDISANDGRNIGHSGHRIGNDIDIRYPGSTNSSGAILWSKAAESYKNDEEFLKILENILEVSSKWGFNKNYAYKVGIKNTTGKATAIHQDHFHLGLR